VNPFLGMALVVSAFAALLASLYAWQRRHPVHPEVLRKLMHVGMGLTALTFPWLFQNTWPVLSLSGGFVILLFLLRTNGPLARRWQDVLGRDRRVSFGELYFPVSVGLLFQFSNGDPILYGIPVLLLTFADSASALIGQRYGLQPYSTEESFKTVEGSMAFFTVAFLSIHVPLLLLTTTGREESLLIGLTLGLLATMLESVGWRGLDNLLVPLGSFVLLKSYLRMEIGELHLIFVCLVLLLAFMVFQHRHTTLKESALLGSTLFCYAIWSVGGWHWLIAPLILLGTYTWFSPRAEANLQRIFDNQAVISVAASGLPWLFLARTLDQSDMRLPYDLSFAAHLAIVGLVRLKRARSTKSGASLLGLVILSAWLLVFVPFFLAEGADRKALVQALCALPGIVLATLIFYRTQPGLDDCPNNVERWVRQTMASAVGSATGLMSIFVN
jgi:phytol kinase